MKRNTATGADCETITDTIAFNGYRHRKLYEVIKTRYYEYCPEKRGEVKHAENPVTRND